jgi:chromosomal replication initiator protein
MSDASESLQPAPAFAMGDIWVTVSAEIQTKVSPQQFETWIRPIRAERTAEETLLLFVSTAFFKDGLQRNFVPMIRSVLRETVGWKNPQVNVAVEAGHEDPAPASRAIEKIAAAVPTFSSTGAADRQVPERLLSGTPSPALKRTEQRGEGLLQLNPEFTLDRFIVGPHNELAEAVARAVVKDPGRHYNPLFVHGRCGLGKSHLLQGICHALLKERPECRIAYVSCESFINQFIAAVEKTDLESFRARFRRLDVLIVDDVHFLANKERSQEEFFHTFNDLHQLSKQIVLSSDCAPPEIPSLSERLVSRFRQGMVVHLDAPLFETRVQIAMRKAESLGKPLGQDVAEFVAKHVQSSVRELCGAVVRVIGVATLMNREITLEMAREALGEVLLDRRPRITLDAIVQAVTEHFGLRRVDLQSKRRTKPLTEPRQICMFLARRLTNLSLEEIGAYFGGRDHSTVLYGAERTSVRYATDADFKRLVDQLAVLSGGSLRG